MGEKKTFLRNSSSDVQLTGHLASENCGVDIYFELAPIYLDLFSVLGFLLINILSVAFHM